MKHIEEHYDFPKWTMRNTKDEDKTTLEQRVNQKISKMSPKKSKSIKKEKAEKLVSEIKFKEFEQWFKANFKSYKDFASKLSKYYKNFYHKVEPRKIALKNNSIYNGFADMSYEFMNRKDTRLNQLNGQNTNEFIKRMTNLYFVQEMNVDYNVDDLIRLYSSEYFAKIDKKA